MKRYGIVLFSLLILLLFLSGTSGKKSVYKCNGRKYSSDATHIRAMGKGRSSNESAAARMANHDAGVQLGKAVDEWLAKKNRKNQSQSFSETTGIEWDDAMLVNESLQMTLRNVSIICTQTQRKKGYFNTIQIVEIPVSEILKSVSPD
jgi:hypothetical protein